MGYSYWKNDNGEIVRYNGGFGVWRLDEEEKEWEMLPQTNEYLRAFLLGGGYIGEITEITENEVNGIINEGVECEEIELTIDDFPTDVSLEYFDPSERARQFIVDYKKNKRTGFGHKDIDHMNIKEIRYIVDVIVPAGITGKGIVMSGIISRRAEMGFKDEGDLSDGLYKLPE